MDTRCSLEDLPEAMDDRDEWRERESKEEIIYMLYRGKEEIHSEIKS